MNEIASKKTKRKFCLLIALAILILLVICAYFISKEVLNTFKILDEGLAKTNQTVAKSNDSLKNLLIKDVQFGKTVKNIEIISSDFNKFLDSTISLLIMSTGGWKENTDELALANPKNINIPTQILVENGLGQELRIRIIETNLAYNQILENELNVDTIQIPLKLDMAHIENTGKTWSEYNFDQMPLMAVLPILRKFKHNENESKALIYRYMANKK